jgi:hypothetical protein
MDFIFDDEVDESGAEIDAYCPKCKSDTSHVVVHKYEDEIRRVQCTPCGDVHPFRKPRGADEEEAPEPVVKKRPAKAKPTWEQVMAKPRKEIKPYVISQEYKDGDLISHPTFGNGFVSESIGLDKIEITFQSGRRILVHNRHGMSLPGSPAIATPPARSPATAPAGREQGQRSRSASRAAAKAKLKTPPKIREVPPPEILEEEEMDHEIDVDDEVFDHEVDEAEEHDEHEETSARRRSGARPASPAKAKPRIKASAKPATKKPLASSAKERPTAVAKGEKKTAAKPPAARSSKPKPKTQAKARAAAPVRSKPARPGAKPAAGKKVKKR